MKKDKNLFAYLFIQIMIKHYQKLAYEFLKKKKYQISQSNINLIVSKCNGDREKLFNELKKIENFSKKKKN